MQVIPRATATRSKRSFGSRKWLLAFSYFSLPTKENEWRLLSVWQKDKGKFNSVLKILGSYCQSSQFSENTEWIFEEFCETETEQWQRGGKDPKLKEHFKIHSPEYSVLFAFFFSPSHIQPIGIFP